MSLADAFRAEGLKLGRTADVVIVGAGIAGLALAYELQKRKISTVLLDRRNAPDNTPRGITFQPNGLEALEKIGILDSVRQLGSENKVLEVRAWNQEVLLEADYGLLDHPQNYILTVNATEVESLLGYKAENSGAEIFWGAQFQGTLWNNATAEGVRYELSNGEVDEVKTAVVVGADGPQSRVRESIGSKTKIRKYPDSFVVGLVGAASGVTRALQYQAPGKMLGLMPVGPETTYLFYCVGNLSFQEVKQAGLGQFKAEVIDVAPEMAEALGPLEAWTRIAYFTPNYVRVDPWVGNGVALLGDAAHAFHPHAGQGVNLSLQDGLALADVIEGAMKTRDFSVRTLGAYQKSRKMFADVIGQHAHWTSTYALSDNWLIKRLNKRALRKLQKSPELKKKALAITAGIFTKKPGWIELARIGGLLP